MPRRNGYARGTGIVAALGVALAVTACMPGCRTPTQVTVELRTVGSLTCAQLKGVAIVVARSAADAEEKMRLSSLSAEIPRGECGPDAHFLGTLVVAPGQSSGAVVVRARVSDGPEATCTAPDYKGCIVARRAFGFIEHASVTMPIGLELACADVPCDVKTSCRSGTCISSDAACSEASGTCDSAAQPVELPDGGTVPPEGGALRDGGGPDGEGEGGPLLNAALDAAKDAPIDAPNDANPALFGNSCPTQLGPVDCNAQAQVCCYQGAYFCQTGCTAGYYDFECVGRKYCDGSATGYCCGNAGGTPGSRCDTTSGQFCSQNGSHYICTSDADCPPSRPRCSGVYYNIGSGTMKECAPGP